VVLLSTPVNLKGLALDKPDAQIAHLELSLLQQAFTAIKFSVMVTDYRQPDNPIVYVNSAFEELTGYKLCDVAGLNPRFLHGNKGNQDGLLEIRDAIKSGRTCTVTLSDTKKDGSHIWVKVNIVPIYNERQELTHFVGFTADISSEKVREEERDYIVAALAHDLKDQVGGAAQIFALMAEGGLGPVSPRMTELLTVLSAGHKEIIHTLENVLEVYRSEKSAELLNLEPLNLTKLLPEWISVLQYLAKERNIQIVCSTTPDNLTCRGDRSSARRMLLNLLQNAIKFSPSDSQITVTATRLSGGVEIAVCDAGTGIAAEEIDTIFAKLGRGKKTRFSPGCGLGLYTCRRLATAHGWKINCRNNDGPGATFIVEIPEKADETPT
jgi:PAS domain S-box-containing protein